MGFDALRKLGVKCLILSTESNSVVKKRAEKLKVPVIQDARDKSKALNEFSSQNDLHMEKIWYIGNDINDLDVMSECGKSFCPSDSHYLVKKKADKVLKTKGGEAVVREVVETILKINIHKILYRE